MSTVPHGGDLAAAEARWGRPAEGWLDLSTGINPLPYPVPPIAPAAWHRLPQHDRLRALLETARSGYGAPADAPVVAAPGTQILIQLLPRLRPGARVAILGPTYGEHAACWSAEGATAITVGSLDEAAGADVVVLVIRTTRMGASSQLSVFWPWPMPWRRAAACWLWTRPLPR